MNVCFVDSQSASYWADNGHRLSWMAASCGARVDARELWVAEGSGKRSVLAACGREADVAPLANASAAFELVKEHPPDVCVVPLRGGLAHGILMGRACGELPSAMRIALVAEVPTRSILMRCGDVGGGPFQPLIADAMERFCLDRADALLVGPRIDVTCLQTICETPPPLIHCIANPLDRGALVRTGHNPKELCFVGPFVRSSNVTTFIEALEALASMDPVPFDRVVFIGPMAEQVRGLGNEWLGRRALNWPFSFRVIETDQLAHAVRYLSRANALAYVPELSATVLDSLYAMHVEPVWLDPESERDPHALKSAIGEMQAGLPVSYAGPDAMGRDALCDALASVELRRKCPPRETDLDIRLLSVCILHKDRPALLREAVDSVLDQISHGMENQLEVIVFDNGSKQIASKAMLDELSTDHRLRVVCQSPALPHTTAMNAMVRHASHRFVAFLDDDNIVAPGGLTALLGACSTNEFDVVTSNLLLFDSDCDVSEPHAKLAFIGPARSAGLFFNFFGDTCMIFRRSTFDRIGGFHDPKAASPAPDWVLLARAQSAGASIGVLQEPAFLYRRNIRNADLHWQKFDQSYVRHLVSTHFGDAFDATLVAKLAQNLTTTFCI